MLFTQYTDINKFIAETMHILTIHEVQNNMPIGLCLKARITGKASNWFMGAVKDENGTPVLVAMMTPPFNLLIYEANNQPNAEALELFIKEIIAQDIAIPGVLTEKGLAHRFAQGYADASGKSIANGMNLRIYMLDKLSPLPAFTGKLRAANNEDISFLPHWNAMYNSDFGYGEIEIPQATQNVQEQLKEHTLYLWQDEVAVSQAAICRYTQNGAVVSAVYTPTRFRGKGYATACVAQLSQLLLERGYKYCSLFTDLANPISNSIYMKLGYKPICDYAEYKFV